MKQSKKGGRNRERSKEESRGAGVHDSSPEERSRLLFTRSGALRDWSRWNRLARGSKARVRQRRSLEKLETKASRLLARNVGILTLRSQRGSSGLTLRTLRRDGRRLRVLALI